MEDLSGPSEILKSLYVLYGVKITKGTNLTKLQRALSVFVMPLDGVIIEQSLFELYFICKKLIKQTYQELSPSSAPYQSMLELPLYSSYFVSTDSLPHIANQSDFLKLHHISN